jgi:hypothetical protein
MQATLFGSEQPQGRQAAWIQSCLGFVKSARVVVAEFLL